MSIPEIAFYYTEKLWNCPTPGSLRERVGGGDSEGPGRALVERIWVRAREKTGRSSLAGALFELERGQILRGVNDPQVPEQGTVVVRAREVV